MQNFIVAPLRRLTHKDVKWRWNKTENDSLKRLKSMLSSCESVHFFDVDLPAELIVDASSFGLGAILTQILNKMQKQIFRTGRLTDMQADH